MTISLTINSRTNDLNENERESYREGVMWKDGDSKKAEEEMGEK